MYLLYYKFKSDSPRLLLSR